MNWRKQLGASWRSALAGAVLCAALGLGLLRWGHELVFLSYDLLFAFRAASAPEEVVIIYMDDRSFNERPQASTPYWDRNLHARLLDQLTEQGAKLVVFDVLFDQAGEPSANTNFARAMRQNGRVVLAAALDSLTRPQALVRNAVLPLPEFQNAAAGWGLTEMMSPEKAVVRQYYVGTETQPSLPWVAARLCGAEIATPAGAAQPDFWLNYYGPALTLRHFSYADVFSQPAGTFRAKFVFVGARPKTLRADDEEDAFRTPHALWENQFMPGVEITATAFLNFMRNDGLAFWPWPNQILLVLAAGLLFGGALALIRPLPAIGLAALGAGGLLFAALAAAQQHAWFAWTVPAFAQIPVALGWSLRCHFHGLKFEKEVLERTLVETSRRAEAGTQPRPSGLVIPDHTLERLVGKGAYGEVWLARNAVGGFHAVKIVRRREFPSDVPYEREFRGIQKFMPVSRSHAGFVHVLHVGRNDAEGCFFCIMEAADDQTSGQRIDPATYSPKTLAGMLAARGKLAPEECLQLGLSLSLALEHLHQQQLIHRDIKPGNIIYVNGAPKLADIGLVTGQGGAGAEVSLVGTEGYIPPEGPGTPAADVYALGKVLYESGMGRDRLVFPEVPTSVWEQPDGSLLRGLNEVICRACETNVNERYSSVGALHAALLKLRDGAD